MSARSARPDWPPRLRTREEAAAYCRLTVPVFERVCPVRPISFDAETSRSDRRLERYDVRSLDEWLDRVGGRAPAAVEGKDWLAEVD